MFSFTYDRPTSIWFYLAMILLPVVSDVRAGCGVLAVFLGCRNEKKV